MKCDDQSGVGHAGRAVRSFDHMTSVAICYGSVSRNAPDLTAVARVHLGGQLHAMRLSLNIRRYLRRRDFRVIMKTCPRPRCRVCRKSFQFVSNPGHVAHRPLLQMARYTTAPRQAQQIARVIKCRRRIIRPPPRPWPGRRGPGLPPPRSRWGCPSSGGLRRGSRAPCGTAIRWPRASRRWSRPGGGIGDG